MTENESNRKNDVLMEKAVGDILTFHDCDDEQLRNQYVYEYFWRVCNEYNLDDKILYDMIEKRLEYKRTHTIFGYEHYNDLKSIIYSGAHAKLKRDDEGQSNQNKRKEEEFEL